MKSLIHLQELFFFYLDQLYLAEKLLPEKLERGIQVASSQNLKKEIIEYIQGCRQKSSQLDVLYFRLHLKPFTAEDRVLNSIIEESNELENSAYFDHLKDAVILTSLQTINNYKIGKYRTTFAIAYQLRLDQALPILSMLQTMEETSREILRWLADKQLLKEAYEVNILKYD
jgi:ferritin-like metal-binding protein YciE